MPPTIITSVLTPAASTALVTLSDVKGDLNVTTTTDDAFFNRRIADLSAAAIAYCGRAFAVETVRDQFWPQRDPFPWQVPGGLMPLQLSRWPLIGSPAGSPLAAPLAPALTASAGGTLAANTAYAVITYQTVEGETLPSPQASLALLINTLLNVAAPPAATDVNGLAAIGWNLYVGAPSGGETKQNSAPLPLGAPWIEPTTGLIVGGAAPPPLASLIEDSVALVEGTDYLVDAKLGQLSRIDSTRYPKRWDALPILADYSAGYATIPADLSGAISRAVKGAYLARYRDPTLKSESASGVYAASYDLGAKQGPSDWPADVLATLDRYRTPTVA